MGPTSLPLAPSSLLKPGLAKMDTLFSSCTTSHAHSIKVCSPHFRKLAGGDLLSYFSFLSWVSFGGLIFLPLLGTISGKANFFFLFYFPVSPLEAVEVSSKLEVFFFPGALSQVHPYASLSMVPLPIEGEMFLFNQTVFFPSSVVRWLLCPTSMPFPPLKTLRSLSSGLGRVFGLFSCFVTPEREFFP